ncbi:Uncharacterised protein [uncultured Clostridium sp.]|uniref:DUF4317 domain-containing protein n=1 Tax=uncultured Clostridium sp. TaxID=59620 RepID=UPI0008231763|nr:DUF4317 domain-containing protein [uncultured Clostridium sp.]SCJ89451.1 Uncharacterised protein [uncultured Clostridium sp.]
MRKKDILELKKRLKKDHCTFTKMCGCYVSGEKHVILKFRETFLNLEEDDYHKYMEIAKKVMSGTIGNNILQLEFPLNEDLVNEKQISLMQLKSSALKDDTLLDSFYESIIENYDYTGNFLILLYHDAYDVITKTKDNAKLDESEEVYEYVLCAICPVSLTAPGLKYYEDENRIKARDRDWVVEAPANGFIFPAFINRSSDVNSIMYYTKNAKDPHYELMEYALGCPSKQTATIQKETFQEIIKGSFGADEKKADKVFMEVQESINNLIEEHNSMYEDVADAEPIIISHNDIQNILIESGVPEELAPKIEKSYSANFGNDLPLAENLIDTKVLKASEQRRKEEHLVRQVEILQNRLEEVKKEAAITKEAINSTEVTESNVDLEAPAKNEAIEAVDNNMDSETDNNLEETNSENTEKKQDTNSDDTVEEITENSPAADETATDYDVVLQVKPEKIPQIKSQIIDGKKFILIPIDEDEQTTVNGLNDLV